ncbi:hypothetical protein PQR72_43705, partial [Paraburkholderia madseniana]
LRLSSTLDRPVNPIQDSVPQLVNRAYQPANVDTVGFVAGDAIKIKSTRTETVKRCQREPLETGQLLEVARNDAPGSMSTN